MESQGIHGIPRYPWNRKVSKESQGIRGIPRYPWNPKVSMESQGIHGMVEMVYRSTHPPQQTGRATRPGSLSQQLLAYGTGTAPPTRRSRREQLVPIVDFLLPEINHSEHISDIAGRDSGICLTCGGAMHGPTIQISSPN